MINPRPLFELLSTQEASVYIEILVEEGRARELLVRFCGFFGIFSGKVPGFCMYDVKGWVAFPEHDVTSFFFFKEAKL